LTCPECGEGQAHRSHRAGLKDRLLGLFQFRPYRCHKCSTRFYAWRSGEHSPKLRTGEERRIIRLRRHRKWQRSKRQLAAYGIATLLLIYFIYTSLQQRV
jgi:hypothetical protein